MTLSLFDHVAPQPAAAPLPAGVRRCVEHKVGPFRLVISGVVSREYRLLELIDGRVFVEFTDNGERRPTTPDISPAFIDERLRAREWREVGA